MDRILWKVKWWQIRHYFREWRRQSRLKIFFIFFFCLVLWGFLYAIFYGAFRFIQSFYELEVQLTEQMFSLFFFALFVLLIFSNGIIIFSSLYRSKETEFLLGKPFLPEDIYLNCFGSAIAFSSWAFLFLAAPLMLAYGVRYHLPFWFYVGVVGVFVVFLLLPASLGGLFALLITYCFPRGRRAVFLVLFLFFVGVGLWVYLDLRPPHRQFDQEWMEQVLGKVAFSRHPLFPSHWMSEAVFALATKNFGEFWMFFSLLFSNSLFFTASSYFFASRLYRASYNKIFSFTPRKRRIQSRLDGVLDILFFPFSVSIRQMLIKDLKIFLRDPVQWSQLLIFLGLLAVYILNINRLDYDIDSPFWKVIMTYLNLLSVSLTLSTFTTRFIFPQISLEGRRFWILGVLPLSRNGLMLGKFLFCFGMTFILSELMTLLSCWMLEVPWELMELNMLLMVLICLGLSGLAVGMGAIYPNFLEENPSKIVSGFGGTLTLLFSLFYTIVMILLQAIPIYLYYNTSILDGIIGPITALSIGVSLLLTGLVTFLPLYWGSRCFERMEF